MGSNTMARALDLARLREQTIGSNGDEEAVTVNTRALIDKVLARYSGDWTTLRELIQNAADALATKVVIRFETLPSKTVPVPSTSDESELLKHTLRHHTAYRLVVSNNGQAFKESDWNRLKRIAEGKSRRKQNRRLWRWLLQRLRRLRGTLCHFWN